jgi:hypothetical protein
MPNVAPAETFPSKIAGALAAISKTHCCRVLTLSALPTGTFLAASVGPNGGQLDTFTVTATGTLTLDGVLTAKDDVIGVFGQATASNNGVYRVATAGATGVSAVLRRIENMSCSQDLQGGNLITTGSEGLANGGKAFLLNTIANPTLNTTGLSVVEVGTQGGSSGTQTGYARAVITTIDVYGGSGTGTLTETTPASGLGTQDGVATLAVGDVVFLPAGTTHITAAKDAGPYVISALGDGTHSWVLTRPEWWGKGAALQGQSYVAITEGTLFASSKWFCDDVKGKVVDTDDPSMYPDKVTQVVTIANGNASNVVVTNVPILSATKTQFIANLKTQAGTSTGIVRYGELVGSTVIGAIGTASVTIQAFLVANVAVSAVSDTSTVTLTIIN